MAESKKHPLSVDRPFPEDKDRGDLASERRGRASHYSRGYAAQSTETNDDEREFASEGFPLSFTKGLPHDQFGQLISREDYELFKKEINQQDATDFETLPRGIPSLKSALTQRIPEPGGKPGTGKCIDWRGWESPRAGHYYDLQGPDADAVGMPPAPEFESEELIAEMAEVYALALLRDVPFSEISAVSDEDVDISAESADEITTAKVLGAISKLSWFAETDRLILEPLSLQARRRLVARRIDHGADFKIDKPPVHKTFKKGLAFRGSGPGAKAGPFISQFMLIGTQQKPAEKGKGTYAESRIAYGTQLIDQKVRTFEAHQDYMLHWNATVDVQNGADFTGDNALLDQMRFIATPRDLAAYVRFDALYQAYLNACLIMLGPDKVFSVQNPLAHPHSKKLGPGFPDRAETDSRQAFASFGGPHVLSLVTEVATRCLKAVRRQKFNYHRRARPERIGELLTLEGTRGAGGSDDVSHNLGERTRSALAKMASEKHLGPLLELVELHNNSLIEKGNADPHLDFDACPDAPWFQVAKNRLLPMAFAEGSPMHPSYGAGHATVAGGCVTMLKAFFHTVKKDDNNCPLAVEWPKARPVVQASRDGTMLEPPKSSENMTINGELNKLAANISIGRNMAGVHFYTDYYESLRMGERVATGILIEQMKQYNEPVEMDFESFDGDHVHILKVDHDYADPRVFVHDARGKEVPFDDWWNRHLVASDTETPPGDEGGEKSVDGTIHHAAATGDRKPEAEDATGRG